MIWCYNNFSKTSEVTDASIVEQRRTFLIKLKNSNEIQSLLLKSSKDAIIDRTKKKQINVTNEVISVNARKRHSPENLEALTPDTFPDNLKNHQLICLNYTRVFVNIQRLCTLTSKLKSMLFVLLLCLCICYKYGLGELFDRVKKTEPALSSYELKKVNGVDMLLATHGDISENVQLVSPR